MNSYSVNKLLMIIKHSLKWFNRNRILKKYSNCMTKTLYALLFFIFITNAHADYQPAYSIYDYSEKITVNKDASYTSIIEETIVIETQRGIDEDSETSIVYNSELATGRILEAYTLQPNGKKILVTDNEIKVKDDRGSTDKIAQDKKRITIIYPEVKVGSKLYYKYEYNHHTPQLDGAFFTSTFFSPHYRYKKYEIALAVHKDLPIYVDTKGMSGGKTKSDDAYERFVYHFSQDNALPTEPYQVDYDDFVPYFMASTFKDQIAFGNAYQREVQDKAMITPAIQSLADQITDGLTAEVDIAKALYHWVSNNIRYGAIYLANGGLVPHYAADILNNLYGDCKDHVVLLEALLKSKGIASSHALINSGDAYSLPKLGIVTPFNHVITYIPSLDIFLDSTAQLAPYGTLPKTVMDKPVMLTALQKLGRTPRNKSANHGVLNTINIIVNADGSMVGSSTTIPFGAAEVYFRGVAISEQDKNTVTVIGRRLAIANASGDGEIITTDPLDLSISFRETTTFALNPITNIPGPSATKIPHGLSLSQVAMIKNIKPLSKLNFPSFCGNGTYEDRYHISFPDNITIKKLPKNVVFMNSNLKYQAIYKQDNNQVTVIRRYEENYPTTVCGNAENEEAKAVYEVMQRDFRSYVLFD
jgi:transglutaminase-like putative cysteine protease